ncbi:MAG: hypothetical protein IJV16_02070 [Lachnospiraceae bacterium]|nr:hypothetical protein [Lachnospiraceae bacterium]MBR1523374.1 hypothetical protein [Lachnospiraceae bacterium]
MFIEREIQSKGLDPAKVTYEQIMEGIEKLKRQKIEAQTEYIAVSKDLRDMEQQMEMMDGYLRQHSPHVKRVELGSKDSSSRDL